MSERLAPRQVVIGTAGHVDHGKSTLVRALTDTNPDRLPEEQKRGMTIELGFAFRAGEHCELAFIDVPGHEKFVRTMVAGAGSIDGALLVIAADAGVSAQTREHWDVLRLLGIPWGRVVVSKADLVDDERLAEVTDEALELVSGSVLAEHPPLAVSSPTGAGLDELVSWLFEQAATRPERDAAANLRLPVDRVFSLAGHGTVVTGTLLSGSLRVGDELSCHPGGRARIRGLQVNKRSVDRALPGQRCAVNLAGIATEDLPRGAWLATPGSLTATTAADILLEALPTQLKHRVLVEVHHGTTRSRGRLHLLEAENVSGGEHRAQLRLEEALALRPGDRLILRRPTPSETIGGALVLAVDAPRHKRFSPQIAERFDALQAGGSAQLDTWLAERWPDIPTLNEAARWAGGEEPLARLLDSDGWQQLSVGQRTYLWSVTSWRRSVEAIATALRAARDKQHWWLDDDRLRRDTHPDLAHDAWEALLGTLAQQGALVHYQQHCSLTESIAAPSGSDSYLQALLRIYQQAGLRPPYDIPACREAGDEERARPSHDALVAMGLLVRLNDRQCVWRAALAEFADAAIAATANDTIDVQWTKQAFDLTRKTAVPLLEWLDAQAITRRVENHRVQGSRPQFSVPLLAPPELMGTLSQI